MTRTFTKDWPHGYVTRDGRKARILDDKLRGQTYPMVAAVEWDDDTETMFTYTSRGVYLSDGRKHNLDLCNAPAPTETLWIVKFADNPDDLKLPLSHVNYRITQSEDAAWAVANDGYYQEKYGPNANIMKMVEETT